MKLDTQTRAQVPLILIAFLNLLFSDTVKAAGLGSAFAYQGGLFESGQPVTGLYDMTFTVFTNLTGGTPITGPLTNLAVGVNNGMYSVTLDFGGGLLNGTPYWLQIGARTNGTGDFVTLAPLQPLLPGAYAIYAENATVAQSANAVAATNISGRLSLGQINAAVLTNGTTTANLSGSFAGNGAGLTNSLGFRLAGLSDATNAAMAVSNAIASAQTLRASINATNGLSSSQLQAQIGGFVLTNALTSTSQHATAVGTGAGNAATGNNVTAFGYQAVYNVSGYGNVGIGMGACDSVSGIANGQYNTAVGVIALDTLANGGSFNTAVGYAALQYTGSGSGNTALGYAAMVSPSQTTGSNNVAIGIWAGHDGFDNVNVGALAGYKQSMPGDGNVCVGYSAGSSMTNSFGNIAIGQYALNKMVGDGVTLDLASDNVAIGDGAMEFALNGDDNVCVGTGAGYQLTNGWFNTFLNVYSGASVTTGSNNVAIGCHALTCTSSNDNHCIAIGYFAGSNTNYPLSSTFDPNSSGNDWGCGFIGSQTMRNPAIGSTPLTNAWCFGWGAMIASNNAAWFGATNFPLSVNVSSNLAVWGQAMLGQAVQIATNAMSSWPAVPASPGACALVNSNGTLYMLQSGAGGRTWGWTNVIGAVH